MDQSTPRHRLAVSWWNEMTFEVFVGSDDGNVEHCWTDNGDCSYGPEDLGGAFDTDPAKEIELVVGTTVPPADRGAWCRSSGEQGPGRAGID